MHLRTNETDGEQLATTSRDGEAERSAVTPEHEAADSRARAAVGAGRVGSLDPAGTRSLQRLAGNAAVSAVLQRKGGANDDLDGSGVQEAIGRSGEKLDSHTSNRLSQGFGVDPGGVELVRDDASTAGVHAKAYTVANKIVVPSSFDTASTDGQRTLAHEFTHVQQQAAGPVDGTPAAGGVSVSDPSDRYEREAESNADRVMGGGFADVAQAGISSSGLQRQATQASVQREAGEDEKDVQTLRVQREAGEDEKDVQTLRVQREAGDDEKDVQTLRVQRSESHEEEKEGE